MEKKNKLTPEQSQAKQEKQLTYDQLNAACNQLLQQNVQLRKQVSDLNVSIAFKRLDYLFKVLEYHDVIKDNDFLISCVNEIKETLTPPEDKDKENGDGYGTENGK